ncbi:hypothetical protein ACTFQF_17575 [Aliivibrio fischeri]|uniref:hypothetical protein n=1 Tax=Aliivibrio fischeri TaxID=668 RepID=UPI003F75A4C1
MIKFSENGFYSTFEPERLFKYERDAKNHDMTLSLKDEELNPQRDSRRLDEMITLWYRLHGKALRESHSIEKTSLSNV